MGQVKDAYKYEKCLVLDSHGMPRSVIWTGRAFVIKLKGNATILHEHPVSFGLVNPDLDIKKPSVIIVKKYVKDEYKKVSLSRENVFKRDGYSCVYCGCNNKAVLTIDHVIPRAKGGTDTWDNLVSACKSCNQEKSDLDLDEYIEMKLDQGVDLNYPDPKRPHYIMLLRSVTHIPDEWKQYLFI